ncbi:T9SS type A sorting domain-containing protein [Lewinella sp. IMCC34191]|uniref:T9SS type A sorting domain-containing protein n=1 Tax=Lewinella sp. IMCC34191 TaxID=2259172 RepID=UPI000E25EE5F|nr:T9SS type A sorting domain-containing protein [Lewinella sp. IMCC34191]
MNVTRIIPLLLFLISFCKLTAQSDYQLFRPEIQYLYEDDEYTPFDQFQRSQFYGVRVDGTGCQELYASMALGEGGKQPCLRRLPSPFGYSICQEADSTVMDFLEQGTMVIYHGAPVGTRWKARQEGEIILTGVVDTIVQESVLGITDSVKRIVLLTQRGDTLHRLAISHTYGVVRSGFLYELPPAGRTLTLAGTSQGELGRQLPADSTYGQVRVGDRYDTETHAPRRTIGPNNSTLYEEYTQETHTVLSIDSTVGDVRYFKTVGDRLTYRVRTDGSSPPEDSTLVRDVVCRRTFSFPGAMVGVQPGARALVDSTDQGLEYRVRFMQDEVCGLTSTRFSDGAYFTDREADCGNLIILIDGGPEPLYTTYVPEMVDTFLIGMYPDRTFLRYLSNDEIECGQPYDFSDIVLATNDLGRGAARIFDLFPNPAGNFFTVDPELSIRTYQLRLFDLSGSVVLEREELRGRQNIALTGLPGGLYVVVVRGSDGSVSARRLIVR